MVIFMKSKKVLVEPERELSFKLTTKIFFKFDTTFLTRSLKPDQIVISILFNYENFVTVLRRTIQI